ncbi:septum formation initiator family protein [Anaerocolumna xylanovorans]|uniref:Septum formation initiator n=1 Tax=Anaerocolumna xylanovorans DSM 12503 TaxID=1121345 RepID=A0A1M7YBI2_9FIRM|nr:septum formation initiator family protein [Anaerocolumna xylanovorans]SHO49961.1 Septum formation initiator [Anaerocolumna xylanovorans DSM 12503]
MEENARKYRQQNNSYYDGNAVRKLRELPYEEEYYPQKARPEKEIPGREEQREQTIPGITRNPRIHRKTRKKQVLDVFSLMVLTVAICITLYTCVGYLNVQTNITRKNNKIAELERKLAKLENDNEANLAKIDTSVDLNYIYNYATKELGMVYPDDKQVINYKRNTSDYMKQYAEIPQTDEKSLLDSIIKK